MGSVTVLLCDDPPGRVVSPLGNRVFSLIVGWASQWMLAVTRGLP